MRSLAGVLVGCLVTGLSIAGSIVPDVRFTLADHLVIDHNGNGQVEPGDVVEYQATLTNNGNLLALAAQVELTPGSGSTLQSGSVVVDPSNTANGHVLSGNWPEDTELIVFLGTVRAGGDQAHFTYRVTIDSPFPDGLDAVLTQGLVTGANFTRSYSVDPDFPRVDGVTETTVNPLAAIPLVSATLTVNLGEDQNENGRFNPGDQAIVSVVIANSGNGLARSVHYHHALNGPLETETGGAAWQFDVGDIEAHGSAEIEYSLRLGPRIYGTRLLSFQGDATGSNFDAVLTDNPATEAPDETWQLVVGNPIGIPILNRQGLWLLAILVLSLGCISFRPS